MMKRWTDLKLRGITMSESRMAWFVWAILLLSLIPVILLGNCAFPCADDFNYGIETARAVAEGRPLWEILAGAGEKTAEYYHSWQGSYSSVFLMQLQPGALFGLQFYFITPLLMLLSVIGGTMLLLRELLVKYLKAGWGQYFLVCGSLLFLTIEYCYFPAEGFYWYNGGIYYTFFYGMALVMMALVLAAMRMEKKGSRILLLAAASVVAVITAGGNYTTALVSLVILAAGTAVLLLKKDRRAKVPLIILIVFTFFFAVSVMAPGNSVRQAGVGGATGALKAILLSFVLGGYIFLNSLRFSTVIVFLCLTPVLYRIVAGSGIRFRYPLLFTAFSLCAFCAQCTPPIYALGINVPERLLNIIYFSFYLLVLLNLLYWCGYLSQKEVSLFSENISQVLKKYTAVVFLCAAALTILTGIAECRIGKGEQGVEITNLPFSAEATLELVSGAGKQFHQQNLKQIEAFRNNPGGDVVVPALTKKPYLLYINEITPDPEDWRNRAISSYFGLSSVRTER